MEVNNVYLFKNRNLINNLIILDSMLYLCEMNNLKIGLHLYIQYILFYLRQ